MIKFPKETNMEGLKELALSLLYLDIQKTRFSPIVVSHPFTSTGTTAQVINGEIRMLNLVESEEDLNTWRKGMTDIINETDKPYSLYFLINKPYALAFVKFAIPYLSQKDFSSLLSDAWIRTEMPSNDSNFKPSEFIKLFKNAEKESLMDAEELQQYNELPDTVSVYRGVKSDRPNKVLQLSWTLDPDKAEWFAKRFDEDGVVYEATIDKKNILALFSRRGEAEIIVDLDYLRDSAEYDIPSEDMSQLQ